MVTALCNVYSSSLPLSQSILSSLPLSGAIEACLGHMLKRRAAGFLRSDKIAALFTKIGKVYAIAEEVCRKVQEQLQQQADITRSELSHLNLLLGTLKLCLSYHGREKLELGIT